MKIRELVERMSLEDKIALCSGADFWHTKKMDQYGIPEIMMTDGPHGLRKQNGEADMLGINDSVPATCFPTAVTTACSWDPKLLKIMGKTIAKEARAQDVSLVLGPGICIKRNPLCGRNFEYLSEDPFLAGKLGAGFIQGVESEGVGSCVKHYALNSQEYKRFNSDSIVDERTLREIYLAAFEIAIKEGKPSAIMTAYNKVNGIHCSEHPYLLRDILRTEWKYDGVAVTDWGGMGNRAEMFANGGDLCMPGGSAFQEKEAYQAVQEGKLDEQRVNESAERILRLVYDKKQTFQIDFNPEDHHNISKMVATESAVLLKNEDKILPLRENQKVGYFGAMAKEMRYQGAGSSHINPTKLEQIIDPKSEEFYAEGCSKNGDTNETLLREARELAGKVDVAVVCVGLTDQYESEGFDRNNIHMPDGHVALIRAVAKANANTVVVLMCGSVVDVSWIDDVKAVLFMGLGGQAAGGAVQDLLFGKVCPSGKLAETWPLKLEDCVSSSYYGTPHKDAEYREGIYVGYRYYEKAGVKVRFPFGYGLSYSTFSYSELKVSEKEVRFSIQNTGDVEAAEISQLYIRNPQNGIYRPIKELRGFRKTRLKPGEIKEVSIPIDDRSFAIYDNGWNVPEGEYEIIIGTSSAGVDEKLCQKIYKSGSIAKAPAWLEDSFYGTAKGIPTREEWIQMLNRAVIETKPVRGNFTMDDSLSDLRKYSMIADKMCAGTEKNIANSMGVEIDYENPAFHMAAVSALDSPIRVAIMCSGGQFPTKLGEAIVDFANGHRIAGLKKLIQIKQR